MINVSFLCLEVKLPQWNPIHIESENSETYSLPVMDACHGRLRIFTFETIQATHVMLEHCVFIKTLVYSFGGTGVWRNTKEQ